MLFKELDKYHQDNLIKLRDYVIGLYGKGETDDRFNMGTYSRSEFGRVLDPEEVTECGTVCCLAGHGPLAGILPGSYSLAEIDTIPTYPELPASTGWECYIRGEFGIEDDDLVWDFLFSDFWSNNIQEAIKRLDMFINGFDPDEDWGVDFDKLFTEHKGGF